MSVIQTKLKILVILVAYFLSAILLGILFAAIPTFHMNVSGAQVLVLFAAYNLFWGAIPYLWVHHKISFSLLRVMTAVGPVMWFFMPYIKLSGGIRFGYQQDAIALHFNLLKNAILHPDYLATYQWIFLWTDCAAIIIFSWAIAPVVRGNTFYFLRTDVKNKGSGKRDTTARLADARWATKEEVQAEYSAKNCIVLGEMTNPRTESHGFKPNLPKSWGKQGSGQLITLDPAIGSGHTFIVSETNGYKTAGIVIANLVHYKGPILLLDPKGDLFARTEHTRRKMGFNPIKISQYDGMDPLRVLKPLMEKHPSVFFHLAENLIPEGPNPTENSKFFRDRGLDLLSGLLYHFVAEDNPDCLKSISELLSLPMDELIEVAVKMGEASPYPFVRNPLLRLRAVDSKGFESLVRSISNKFKFAEFPDVRGYITEPEGSAKYAEVLKPDTDIFINIPSRLLKSFGPMVHLLLASVLTATQMTEQPERPSARRLLILDEAKGLGNMDVLELIRDEGRAVGLHLMMIYQTWGQVKNIWGPDAASAWEDSVDARIVGATQDTQRATAIQNIIGKDSVLIRTNSKSRSQRDMEMRGQSSNSHSEQMREVPLITTAEIGNFPSHGAIILTRRTKPILASKAIYFTRLDMKDLVKSSDEVRDELEVAGIAAQPGDKLAVLDHPNAEAALEDD